jgi:hypothetical protein
VVKKARQENSRQTERREQLAKALKANLKRRKAQALARSPRPVEKKP